MIDDNERISLGGAELSHRTFGAGPGKPPMIFLPGYGFSATAGLYDDLLERLAQRYVVHALDLRGFGASAAAVSGWSIPAIAADIDAFARALDLDTPVVVGHSFGAVMALAAAALYPKSFSAVCMLAPGPADPKDDPGHGIQFLIDFASDRAALSDGFRRMYVRPPSDSLDLVLDAVVLAHIDVHRAMLVENAKPMIYRMGDVTVPVLLVCGQLDTVIPPEVQHDVARKLERCKQVTFFTEGHMLPLESPAMAAREVLAFLEHDRASMALFAADGTAANPSNPWYEG